MNINKLHYACFKILPLVYDDSLSYYEVVCKVAEKINELVDSNNQLPDEIAKEIQSQLESGAKLEMIDTILKVIAPTETDTYTVNAKVGSEVFWLTLNDKTALYECIKPMNAGTNYIIGTNIREIDLQSEIKHISDFICTSNEHYNERAKNAHEINSLFIYKDQLVKAVTYINADEILVGKFEVVSLADLEYSNLKQIDTNRADIANLKTADTNINKRIDNIVSQSGNDNTEIVDARLGVNGTVYSSLGTAIRSQVGELNGDITHTINVANNNDYHYHEPVKNIEYSANKPYGHIYSKKQFYLKKGTLLKIYPVEGMSICYRINNVNHFIKHDYIFTEDVENAELRVYYSDTTINMNDYIKMYFPTFPFGKPNTGFVNDMYFSKYYLIDDLGTIDYSPIRESTADMQFNNGTELKIADGYKFKVNIWKDEKYTISDWMTKYLFTEDCTANILIRRTDNSSISEKLTDVLYISIDGKELNEDPYTFNYSLANRLFHEDIIFENNGNGAQGIANDDNYVYCFSGNGTVVKINKTTKEAVTLNIDGLEHANSATYNSDDKLFYVVGSSTTNIYELNNTLEKINKYDSNGTTGISYLNGKIYCLNTDKTVKVYDKTFNLLSSVTLFPSISSGLIMQGFETDGLYFYVPLYDPANNKHSIYVYDMVGKYIGRRYLENTSFEVEDITTDINTGEYYISYQYGSNFRMAVSKLVDDSGWINAKKYITSTSINTVIDGFKRPVMFRVFGNYLYLKGVIKSSDTGNILRLPSAIMPKDSEERIIKAIDSEGNEIDCNVYLGTTTEGIGNLTYPMYKKTEGELVLILDGIKILCEALIY